jgi:peptidyl-prolyl cis-trans isomerase SurA
MRMIQRAFRGFGQTTKLIEQIIIQRGIGSRQPWRDTIELPSSIENCIFRAGQAKFSMSMKRILLASCVVLFASAGLAADSVVEEIIARVNNQIITLSEFNRSKEQLKQEAQQQDPASASKVVAEKQKDILRDLVDQQLLLDRGKDLGITADTELIKRLDDMRKQMNLENMEDLEKAAQAQGVSYEDFKQNMRNQIITQQVIGREVGQHLSITKEEEQAFYDQHKSEMEQPEQVKLSEILVAPAKPAGQAADAKAPVTADDPQAIAAAQAKAEELLAEIKKGAAFDEVAKKSSEGPTAQQGGDLGYFKRGMLAKELEDKLFAMKAGEMTDAIRTKQGFVILKVTDHQQAGVPTMKEVEPRLMDAIYMEKLQPALRAYLTKLREDAYIYYKPGYVDTGASANQTNPVETTTKEASAKKFKKKKKLGII